MNILFFLFCFIINKVDITKSMNFFLKICFLTKIAFSGLMTQKLEISSFIKILFPTNDFFTYIYPINFLQVMLDCVEVLSIWKPSNMFELNPLVKIISHHWTRVLLYTIYSNTRLHEQFISYTCEHVFKFLSFHFRWVNVGLYFVEEM